MNELLISVEAANFLVDSRGLGRQDVRDINGEAHTLGWTAFIWKRETGRATQYLFVVQDHRDKFWGAQRSEPTNGTEPAWLFTRMVDGDEYVVFRETEAFEETVVNFRFVE